jgi:hypothetical protein
LTSINPARAALLSCVNSLTGRLAQRPGPAVALRRSGRSVAGYLGT